MIWDPVFSPDSDTVAAKAEQDKKYFIVLDGKRGKQAYDALWPPVFSPDGSKLLVRAVENGKYCRRVMPLGEL